MKTIMPPAMKKGAKPGKEAKSGVMPGKGKRDDAETMPEGDEAPKRADRPARKSGGAVKKGC